MKLTIVLTVFNKESYLRRSFNALLNQDHTQSGDYEVLVVNDGSTDGSEAIIEEYANRDTRIRVLNQENLGLSMARNNGVGAARGEYIWFVDSDDIISPNAVKKICDVISMHPDIIPIYARTSGEERVRNCIDPNSKSGKEILIQSRWEPCGVFTVAKRSFLNNSKLCFFPGIYHEDDEYTPRMLYAAQSAIVIPEVLYTVIHEPNSITGVPRAKRAFDNLTVAEHLARFVENTGEVETKIGKAIYDHAALCINNGLNIISQNTNEEQKRFDEELSKKLRFILVSLLSASQRKYRIEGQLFRVIRKRFVDIYMSLQKFNRTAR